MKFGLGIVNFKWPGGEAEIGKHLAEIGRTAEDAGFDSLWVWDHFVDLARWEDPLLEGWLTLANLAASTKRVMLGTLVTGVTYRYPAILVKQATTLDVLSGGRLFFGVGAAWNEREHHAFGAPFPPLKERFELLEDCLQIAHRAWRGERGNFEGKRVTLTEQIDSPPPVQRPHPRILIGGGGERKTLRLVAKYADATHQTTSDPAVFRHKMDVLREHCADIDRNFDEIERWSSLETRAPDRRDRVGDASAIVERAGRLAEVGVQCVTLTLPDMSGLKSIEQFGRDVIPQARNLEPAAVA
jgi:F420-dependent oxidoreductase-like protein